MAKDILKEAIADAKAVREVALANAKAALEEAFTPKLQSMLSARLSEDMDEEMMDEEMDEEKMDEEMDEEMMDEVKDDDKKDEAADMEERASQGFGDPGAKNTAGSNAGYTPAKTTKGDGKLHEGFTARMKKLANIKG